VTGGPVDDAVYLLPLRADRVLPTELLAYLAEVRRVLPVVVLDGSPGLVRDRNATLLPAGVRHVPVSVPAGHNGKAVAVNAGLRATDQARVVVADDDVRWTPADLRRALAMVDAVPGAVDLVRPQNVFRPAPWHARWDAARSLVNRAGGGDWPGTLVLRRAALPADGYATRVLFENRQLVRTIVARGGRERVARDLVVARRPASLGRFLEQRVRQAYDSQAQPARMLAELALLPALAVGVARARRPGVGVAAAALAVTGVAAAGRLRGGGRDAFAATAPAWAPLWAAERAVCAWLALGLRLRGGVPYAGTRLRHAGLPLDARGTWCPW
jgi:hypothetical protein